MSAPEPINDLLLASMVATSTALTGITTSLLQDPSELNALVDDFRTEVPQPSSRYTERGNT